MLTCRIRQGMSTLPHVERSELEAHTDRTLQFGRLSCGNLGFHMVFRSNLKKNTQTINTNCAWN